MKCLILGAGQGNRLMPLTSFIPKYMLPFGDRTIIDRGIETIVSLGLNPILVTRKGRIRPKIQTIEVPEAKKNDLIETLYNTRSCIEEDNFCWTGGEVLLRDLDFEGALEEHIRKNAFATFFHVPNLRFTPRGNLQKGRITKFSSDCKDKRDYSFIPFVITNKRAFSEMGRHGYTFMEAAVSGGEVVLSFEFLGKLWNVDTPSEYFQASRDTFGEYIDSLSRVERSRLKRSFIYNSRIRGSFVKDSIVINADISNQRLNRKIVYGGKNGCSLDIPN